jgi:hypothetical protein
MASPFSGRAIRNGKTPDDRLGKLLKYERDSFKVFPIVWHTERRVLYSAGSHFGSVQCAFSYKIAANFIFTSRLAACQEIILAACPDV